MEFSSTDLWSRRVRAGPLGARHCKDAFASWAGTRREGGAACRLVFRQTKPLRRGLPIWVRGARACAFAIVQ